LTAAGGRAPAASLRRTFTSGASSWRTGFAGRSPLHDSRPDTATIQDLTPQRRNVSRPDTATIQDLTPRRLTPQDRHRKTDTARPRSIAAAALHQGGVKNSSLDSEAAILPFMKLTRLVPALAAGLLASGCVVVPITRDSYDDDCKVATHHMELTTVQVKEVGVCHTPLNVNGALCVLGAVGLATVSTVVSGSVVVVGNVAYWTERKAACVAPSLGIARNS